MQQHADSLAERVYAWIGENPLGGDEERRVEELFEKVLDNAPGSLPSHGSSVSLCSNGGECSFWTSPSSRTGYEDPERRRIEDDKKRLRKWLVERSDGSPESDRILEYVGWLTERPDICSGCDGLVSGYEYPEWWPYHGHYEVTSDNYREIVHQDQIPTAILFTEWGNNGEYRREIEKLAVEFEGRLRVGVLFIMKSPEIAVNSWVAGAPTLVVYQGGRPCEMIEDYPGKMQLKRLFESISKDGSTLTPVPPQSSVAEELGLEAVLAGSPPASDTAAEGATMADVVEWMEENERQNNSGRQGQKGAPAASKWRRLRQACQEPIRKSQDWARVIDAFEGILLKLFPRDGSHHHLDKCVRVSRRKDVYKEFLKRSEQILFSSPVGEPCRKLVESLEEADSTEEQRARAALVCFAYRSPIDTQLQTHKSWLPLVLYTFGKIGKYDMKTISEVAALLEATRHEAFRGISREEWMTPLWRLAFGASVFDTTRTTGSAVYDALKGMHHSVFEGSCGDRYLPSEYREVLREVLLNSHCYDRGSYAEERRFLYVD